MTRHNICARFWNYCFWMNVGGQVEATTIKRTAEKQLRHHTPWVCQKQLPPHVITSSVHLQGNDVMRISVISIQTAVELSNLPLKLISDACVQPKVWAANLCSLFRETRKYFVAVVWLPLYPSSHTSGPQTKGGPPIQAASAGLCGTHFSSKVWLFFTIQGVPYAVSIKYHPVFETEQSLHGS